MHAPPSKSHHMHPNARPPVSYPKIPPLPRRHIVRYHPGNCTMVIWIHPYCIRIKDLVYGWILLYIRWRIVVVVVMLRNSDCSMKLLLLIRKWWYLPYHDDVFLLFPYRFFQWPIVRVDDCSYYDDNTCLTLLWIVRSLSSSQVIESRWTSQVRSPPFHLHHQQNWVIIIYVADVVDRLWTTPPPCFYCGQSCCCCCCCY